MEIIIFDSASKHKAMLFVAVAFALMLLMLIAILLDLWDGLYTAKKTGKPIKSHILRITIAKVSEYWRFMMIGVLFDCVGFLFPFYAMPYVSILFFVGLVGVEVKSMMEHAKRRKSHVNDATEIIRKIVECATHEKARELMDLITATQKSHLEIDGYR